MQRTCVLATAFVLGALGCGGPPPSVPVLPPASPPASVAAPVAVAPPPPAKECSAVLAKRQTVDRVGRKPGDWTRVGTVVVTMKDTKPSRFVLKDRDGANVSSATAPDSAPAFRDAVRIEACRIGGESVVAEADPPDNGAYALSVWRPVKPSEDDDLAYVCKGPPGPVGEGLEPAQLRVVAVEAYEVMLTSPKWRTFFRSLHEDLKKKGADVLETRRARAAELRSASPDCWFSRMLEK